WKYAVESTLDAYLGQAPATFIYNGKLYSPKSFARKMIGINPSDYFEVTSYSHLPFNEMVSLTIPANWNEKKYLNLPIGAFEKLINNALENGYSLAWDGDATEPEFDFEKGIAKLPNAQEKIKITQTLRQKTFEDKSTTDDHNMHIIGKAKDVNGIMYYIMKNSEGNNEMHGYVLMSKNALLLKTISVLVHKDMLDLP
ncbi:MAG: C1 family peptidase, partial [Bacteroidota bacterium]